MQDELLRTYWQTKVSTVLLFFGGSLPTVCSLLLDDKEEYEGQLSDPSTTRPPRGD